MSITKRSLCVATLVTALASPVVAQPSEPEATPAETAEQTAPAPSEAAPVALPEATLADETSEPAPVAEPAMAPEPAADEAPRNRAEELGWKDKHAGGKVYFKPGKGLTVESEDGEFKLETRLRGQFLYELTKEDGAGAEQLFNVRRARVQFGGHWWGEDNTFKMELAVSPNDLGMTSASAEFDKDEPITDKSVRVSRSPLLDLYVEFKQVRDLNVRVGQYKIPFSRQRVISSGDLMFVDRTIVNSEFTLDRDLGFDLRSKDLFGWDEKLRYYAGVYTGEGHSSFAAHPVSSAKHGFGLNVLARLEYLPLGDFKDYNESDLERTDGPGLSLGASVAHVGQAQGNRGVIGNEPADEGTTDYTFAELDAIFKYRGLSIQSEFMYRNGTRNNDGTLDTDGDGMDDIELEAARNGWGLTGQIGYVCPLNVEFAVRHSAVRGTGTTSLSDKNETGFALSYYVAGHPYKVQADYLRIYGDSIDDGEHQFRTQLQVSL